MKPLLIAVLFAAAGFAASPATSMLVQTRRVFVSTNGSTVVTAHSFEYPDPSGVTYGFLVYSRSNGFVVGVMIAK